MKQRTIAREVSIKGSALPRAGVVRRPRLDYAAIGVTLAAFLAARFHLQLRVFPMWQQTTMVGVLVLLVGATLWWTDGMAGQPSSLLLRVPGAITTALLWPWLAEMMRGVARRSDAL